MTQFSCLWLALIVTLLGPAALADAPQNTLTAAERAEGWRLLFDGRSLAGWRGYKKQDATGTRWTVKDGSL